MLDCLFIGYNWLQEVEKQQLQNIQWEFKGQKQAFEEKQNSLLNLVIDGTIDKEMYNAKKVELNKKNKENTSGDVS